MKKYPSCNSFSRIEVSCLKLPEPRVSIKVNREQMNQGCEYYLEIPVWAKLEDHTKRVAWEKEKIQIEHEVQNDQVQRFKGTLH